MSRDALTSLHCERKDVNQTRAQQHVDSPRFSVTSWRPPVATCWCWGCSARRCSARWRRRALRRRRSCCCRRRRRDASAASPSARSGSSDSCAGRSAQLCARKIDPYQAKVPSPLSVKSFGSQRSTVGQFVNNRFDSGDHWIGNRLASSPKGDSVSDRVFCMD